jgi:hypothetical protein
MSPSAGPDPATWMGVILDFAVDAAPTGPAR